MKQLYLNYIQKNAGIKILISILLIIVFAITANYTHNPIYIKLFIIPGLYMIPMFITLLVYGVIGLIKDIKSK